MDSNEFIEKVIIPSIDKDENPYLSAFFNAADGIGMGSTAYNALEVLEMLLTGLRGFKMGYSL